MKIAVLSGKGGAGKTLVAVNLAASSKNAVYVDCDVEEPNGRLFFHPTIQKKMEVTTRLPEFDAEKCNGCKKCVEFCRFHALVYIKEKPKVFSEVCHACGGCELVCPADAISESERTIGHIEVGYRENTKVITGILNPGESSGVPVIEAARDASKNQAECVVYDCPPGSACPVIESIMDADYCILVAEPTAFGFHNVKMVYELASLLHKPCGVVINKQEEFYEPLETFCEKKELPILLRLPFSKEIARTLSNGEVLVKHDKYYRELFQDILQKIGGGLE